MIRGLLRILLYVAIGPFIGSVGAVLAIGTATLVQSGSFRDFSGAEALVSPQMLIVSYTLGTLPALLTAIVGIVIERQMIGWRHWLWSALSGAIIACILAWLTFGLAPVSEGLMPVVFISVIGSAGALAGFLCAALFDALALRVGGR
jgi:hypothetical protein